MQTQEHNDIDQLITLYLSGELDEPSFDKLKCWSLESEANRRYVRNRIEVWFSSGASSGSVHFDKNRAFKQFKVRVAETQKDQQARYHFPWRMVCRVAAVVLILLLPLAAYWQGKETVKGDFSDMVVEVPLGARTKLHLPDGTLVWLNAGSKITYSQGFGVDDRKLVMEGEGYFEVMKNEKIPFEINTKELNLRVLGTKFNFRNYQDDKEVTVNLLEGKVALRNGLRAMPDIYLKPNEKIVLDKQTGRMKKAKTNAAHASIWKNDELFFDEDLLEDIAKCLMRSYDVKIEVADSLRNKRFYGSFKVVGNTIDNVLKTMASTQQMKYRYENETYILY